MATKSKTYNPRVVRPVKHRRFRGRWNKGQAHALRPEYVEDGFNFYSDRIGRQSTRYGQGRGTICDGGKFDNEIHSGKNGVGYLAMGEGGNVWVCTNRLARGQADINTVSVDPYKPTLDFGYDPARPIGLPDWDSIGGQPNPGNFDTPARDLSFTSKTVGLPAPPPQGGAAVQNCYLLRVPVPVKQTATPIKKALRRSFGKLVTNACFIPPAEPDATAEEYFDTTIEEELARNGPPTTRAVFPFNPSTDYSGEETSSATSNGFGQSGCAAGEQYRYELGGVSWDIYVVGYCYTTEPIEHTGTDWFEADITYSDGTKTTVPIGDYDSSTGVATFCDPIPGGSSTADQLIANGIKVEGDESKSDVPKVEIFGVYYKCDNGTV